MGVPCPQGLLTEYGKSLANLTHLDVGACRWGRGGAGLRRAKVWVGG